MNWKRLNPSSRTLKSSFVIQMAVMVFLNLTKFTFFPHIFSLLSFSHRPPYWILCLLPLVGHLPPHQKTIKSFAVYSQYPLPWLQVPYPVLLAIELNSAQPEDSTKKKEQITNQNPYMVIKKGQLHPLPRDFS